MKIKDLALVALFAALMAVSALIRIQIFVVPFSMQMQVVFLSGLLLGGRLGPMAQGLYLGLGLLGLPVFTGGGGLSYLVHPSFGYLLGFVFASALIGRMAGPQRPASFKRAFLWNLCGLALVYLLGVGHLFLIKTLYLHQAYPLSRALLYGLVIFLPSDLCHAFLAAKISLRLRPFA